MKLSKKPGKDEKQAASQIKKFFKTDEELVSMVLTYMGVMSILLDFMADTYGTQEKIHELPERTKYGMAQAIAHYKILGQIVREEMTPEQFGLRWMSIRDDAWKAPKEISERMVFVVKQLYKQLQDEGKL